MSLFGIASNFQATSELFVTWVTDGDDGYCRPRVRGSRKANTPLSPSHLSDVDAFLESWNCVGEDLLPEDLRGLERLSIRCRLVWHRSGGWDGPEEWDEELEVLDVIECMTRIDGEPDA